MSKILKYSGLAGMLLITACIGFAGFLQTLVYIGVWLFGLFFGLILSYDPAYQAMISLAVDMLHKKGSKKK